MKNIYFIIPDFGESLTGGTIYDDQVIRELKKSNDRLKQENEKYLGRGIERYVVKKTTLS